jgi:hypothetical protein
MCEAAAHAQQAKIPKIGWLQVGPSTPDAGLDLFRREIRALGYIESQNISFEYRSADNRVDRLPALADELVRLKVDILLVASANGGHRCQERYQNDPHR